ncbi:1871_t:CDS:2, partial [Gigaspora rosea]
GFSKLAIFFLASARFFSFAITNISISTYIKLVSLKLAANIVSNNLSVIFGL